MRDLFHAHIIEISCKFVGKITSTSNAHPSLNFEPNLVTKPT
jgi:hypothetical protein